MTVRWKPLLLLSGLFVVIAVVGLAAMAYTLIPRGAKDILPAARAERAARRYEKAVIHYKRALQMDGRNPAIHEEVAAMYDDWAPQAPPEKRPELRALRVVSLAEAAKYGKSLKGPRRQLLAAVMDLDEPAEARHWAKEVLTLAPDDADAHYVLASEALEDRNPALPEVQRHIEALEAAKAPGVRLAWVKAKLAQTRGDAEAREAVLAGARGLTLPSNAGPVDRTALVRLRALDVETTTDAARLAGRVEALRAGVEALTADKDIAPTRVIRVSRVLEGAQKSLGLTASQAKPADRAAIKQLDDAIESDFDAIFKGALQTAGRTDLGVYLTYADHLRYRGQRARCLEVVNEALKSKLAKLTTAHDTVMGLHAVAVESALNETKDASRFEKAAPHIKDLIAASSPRFQGLGHLYQGAIDLEQAGLSGANPSAPSAASPDAAARPKLRASALNHLKLAAEQLPDVVEAQARYGVALVLSQEPSLGRQYLLNAVRQGNAEPQYQVWAALSVVQAGYPEEAEPIVNHLLAELSAGRVSKDLEGTLHLLRGEIFQARRTPDDLRKALAEYARSYDGKSVPPAVMLRMAQIDGQLGQPGQAIRRIEAMRAKNVGGPGAEHLAVLTLIEQGKAADATAVLAKARQAYPKSEELVGLEAALLARDGKAKEADAVLADFLSRAPENVTVVLMRAQVLSDLLNDAKAARLLLSNVADRSENSAPLVQLALLDLKQKDFDAVAGTVAKIRARWKDAAVADLLDAQLAVDQGNFSEAAGHFDAALKKDPNDKLVQFWKAQIDTRVGARGEAAKAFESLARDGTSKQLDSGLTLATAARSALANLALQNGDLDGAIQKFESLRSGGTLSSLARGDRWQLVAAYLAKNQWPAARRELAALLNDPKSPASYDERVRAANVYRTNNEPEAAVAQLEYVLGQSPAHPSAVITRAVMLAESGKPEEAASVIRRAIASPTKAAEKPPAVFYLVLAALENISKPEKGAGDRALKVVEQGLAVQPKAAELVQAKYQLLVASKGPAEALAYVEGAAKGEATGPLPRMLADIYRDQNDLDNAGKLLRSLAEKSPKDATLAASLVRVTALRAAKASEAGDRDRERAINDETAGLIKDFRKAFPREVAFLEEECELAFRRGDVSRATAVTNEIDQLARSSPAGPLLRARLYAFQGRPRDVASAYAEAVKRSPQNAIRVLYGQASLKAGDPDEALRQARTVLEADKDRVDAVLLLARALALSDGPAADAAGRRSQAVEALDAALKRQPKVAALYHQLAEIQLASNQRPAAVKTLKGGVEAVPDDAAGLALLVETLCQPTRPGAAPSARDVADARSIAEAADGRDPKGTLALAVAVGFHKAGQLALAETWAKKSSGRLDAPVLHLNYGDILLSMAESAPDAESARPYFRRAVDQYDLVLKAQANSVEAINNKAWILHTYLGESRKALELAQGLVARVDPSTLPGEFFDTLGAIQESMGNRREAETSYAKGLTKAPDHPVLNFHMGKLIVAQGTGSDRARSYLEKALSGRDKLPPLMAAEADRLMEKAQRN